MPNITRIVAKLLDVERRLEPNTTARELLVEAIDELNVLPSLYVPSVHHPPASEFQAEEPWPLREPTPADLNPITHDSPDRIQEAPGWANAPPFSR